ncbi:MAG: imidazolonepropionase [Deltaproteobacteria bacterium]|nr:imidazolonepropionase [Deltaproteobacteria bacterium]
MNPDLVIRNARVLTCDPSRFGLGMVDRGAIAIRAGVIEWVGPDADRPGATRVVDAGGRLVTPGLVDCHTHAIFAGDRANEFAMRAAGKTYLEIAAAGGGIGATLGPTRAATDETLVALLLARLDLALAAGTTTMEIKSGYDLTVAGELRLLRCIAAAGRRPAPRIVPTLLAHLVPPERKADRSAYIIELRDQLIPQVATDKLAASVDIYCDEGAFTLAETRSILGAAKIAGLPVRGHVGQFTDLGAAELLADLAALSADHLEQITDRGIEQLASAGVVAVMLPGACVQLRLPVPPVEKLRAAGVLMAIASDLNPGSSYCEQLPLQMWLATTHYGMTVEEAWLGVTRHAAKALGLPTGGTLQADVQADLIVWACDDPATVPYRYGAASSLIESVYVGGVRCGMAVS